MKIIKLLFIITITFQKIKNEENQNKTFYRCGVDDDKTIPLPAKNFVKIDKDKRKLDNSDDNFKDFHIYLDLINIKKGIQKFHLEKYEELFINSLNKVVSTLESLLKVKRLENSYTFSDEDIITNLDIEDWNKTMIGTNAIGDTYTLGIDLFIFGRFDDEMDNTTLANAGARFMVEETGQPLIGVVNINTNVNYSKINSQEYFQSIIIHEFTHILGFSNYFFITYMNNIFSKVDEYGIQRFYINSSRVLETAKKYFNCSDIDGVELEESGGSGTVGSHWEARILLGEYMNGVIYPEEQVISEFTLALLEDTGYYKANYYTGGLMRFGKGKGCDFIKERCVNSSHKINPNFENEFFDTIDSDFLIDASCTSGRQSRTYYTLWVYDSIPNYYKYFENETYGGYSPADFCPVAMEYFYENINSYYTGHCSLKGNGGYGTQILYNGGIRRINNTHVETIIISNKSEELYFITGENYSDHSFCYQSTLIKNEQDYDYLSIVRAVCYESFCSNYSLTIKINEDYFVCPRTGGKIEVEGYKGYFLCPDYNLICSGTIMCNDMFDCIDKKSEAKEESYFFNYKSKTSQNIANNELILPDNENNYELDSNGICPINCKQCHLNNKCTKCRNDYGLVGSKENEEIHCLSLKELSSGYYQENNIYYPLIEDTKKIISENSDEEKTPNSFESESQNIKNEISDELQSDSNNYDDDNKDSIINPSDSMEFETDNLPYHKNTTSIIDIDNNIPFFELIILQVRILNNTLTIFATISIKLTKLYHIIISIGLYKNNNNRNLAESEIKDKQLELYIDENDKIEPGKIIKLTSHEEFDENDRIVVYPKTTTEYQAKVLNNDDRILDSKENLNMIKNNEIVDLSNNYLEQTIKIYKIISASSGCKFDLTSNSNINDESQDFSLKFIEKSNRNNIIDAKCNLQKSNDNKIPCSLEEEVNKNYILDSSTFSNEQNVIFTISPVNNEKTFNLCCVNNDKKIGGVNLGMIIIICGVLFIVIVLTIIIVVICCKRERFNKIYNTQMQRHDIYSNDSFSENESNYNWKKKKNSYK